MGGGHSPPRRRGVARQSQTGAPGAKREPRRAKPQLVVSSAKRCAGLLLRLRPIGLELRATPSAPLRRLRAIFLVAQPPPLRGEECRTKTLGASFDLIRCRHLNCEPIFTVEEIMNRCSWIVALVGLVLCGITSTAWAQGTAQLSGTVRDQSAAVLPGVEVSATQTATGTRRTVVTNETGSY